MYTVLLQQYSMRQRYGGYYDARLAFVFIESSCFCSRAISALYLSPYSVLQPAGRT